MQKKSKQIDEILTKNASLIQEYEQNLKQIIDEIKKVQRYSIRYYELVAEEEKLSEILEETKNQSKTLPYYREKIISKDFDFVPLELWESLLDKGLAFDSSTIQNEPETIAKLKREKMIASQMPLYDRYAVLLEKKENKTISETELKEMKKLSKQREVAYCKAKIHEVRNKMESDPSSINRESLKNLKAELQRIKHPKLEFLKDLVSDIFDFNQSSYSYEEEQKDAKRALGAAATILLMSDD